MNTKIKPHITLIGAGPGDLELITVKGLNALKKADVILYDALVNEELLDYAPIAKKIFVGKRKGLKAYSQEEINKLLVLNAMEYGHAVRLKGGDSYVFGRGFEEKLAAEKYGITVDVIPGISSSISVPALAGVPVTHRGIGNSFQVISATLENGKINPDLLHAAQGNGTVVILMGLGKLSEIVSIYQRIGKSTLPVAIISNGSLDNQETISGNIETIAKLHTETPLPAPAVIVVGEVVGFLNQQKELRESKTILSGILN